MLRKLREAGLGPAHLDATLIAERPDLTEHRAGIRERMTTLLELTEGQLNVKAAGPHGLGALGKGEGVAALVVVSLEERAP